MKTEDKKIRRRIDRFIQTCRNSGAKLTHQRMEIFRELAKNQNHPDAETVYQGVLERMPTLSRDTVYRTLWWLKEMGLITTLGPPREKTRFDANLNHHHHFVCVKCGLTKDFYSERLDRIDLPDSVKSIGHAETMRVEVKGVCRNCMAAETGSP